MGDLKLTQDVIREVFLFLKIKDVNLPEDWMYTFPVGWNWDTFQLEFEKINV